MMDRGHHILTPGSPLKTWIFLFQKDSPLHNDGIIISQRTPFKKRFVGVVKIYPDEATFKKFCGSLNKGTAWLSYKEKVNTLEV